MTLIACYWNGGQCLHSADRGSIQKILSGNSQLCVSVCVGMICLYALLLLLPLLSFSLSLVCFNRTVAVENINRCEKVGERTKRREISEQHKMLKKEEMDAGQAKERDNASGNVIGNGKGQSRSN